MPRASNAGEAHPEDDEEIELRLVKLSELLKMIEKGAILDGKTLTSVLLYARLQESPGKSSSTPLAFLFHAERSALCALSVSAPSPPYHPVEPVNSATFRLFLASYTNTVRCSP